MRKMKRIAGMILRGAILFSFGLTLQAAALYAHSGVWMHLLLAVAGFAWAMAYALILLPTGGVVDDQDNTRKAA